MQNPGSSLIEKWVPIVGRWSIDVTGVHYLGPQGQPPFGICLSNVDLSDGLVFARIRVSQEAEGRIIFGFTSMAERYLMAGIAGWRSAYSIGEFLPEMGWRPLAAVGLASNLSAEHLYDVAVDISGQRVSLTIEGVRLLRHLLDKPLTAGQVGLFAFGQESVDFSEISVAGVPGSVFVVMQFSEPYRQLYEEVIHPVAESFGLEAYHVGEKFGPGLILNDIVQGIAEAKIIVAEITPINQNVFYELGYAHALGKPTILLAERDRDLPFDISGYRVLFYDNTIGGKRQGEEGLRKHLAAILQRPIRERRDPKDERP